jgi:hypothetical protein
MQKILLGVALFALFALAAVAARASAGELTLKIANGRATLIAQDVPARQILAEWTRLGGTRIINGEKVIGPPLTVQLVDRPEREVLDFVLRSASGYVAAPRAEASPNLSMYDRVVILATSQPPAYTPSSVSAPTFTRPPTPVVDDDPVEQPAPVPTGAAQPAGMAPGFPGMPNPAAANPGPQATPGMPNQPMTAPRPGMLPAPPQGAPNPFVPPNPNQPVLRPPGGGRGGGL